MADFEKIAVATFAYQDQLQFYRDVLGLPLLSEIGGVAMLACGDQVLLISDLNRNPNANAILQPLTGTTADLEYTIPRIDRDAWVEYLRRTGYYAYRDSYSDFDGNVLHFRYGDPTSPGYGPASAAPSDAAETAETAAETAAEAAPDESAVTETVEKSS